ncbi:MAG TPA: hypothetical protein VJ656_07565, partial [Pyrinomonadaceae bacterium]|nr:hypothetical protein [Pyrinomonadaceae bacterium]
PILQPQGPIPPVFSPQSNAFSASINNYKGTQKLRFLGIFAACIPDLTDTHSTFIMPLRSATE